eukprot:317479_1
MMKCCIFLLVVYWQIVFAEDSLECIHRCDRGVIIDADIIFVHGLGGHWKNTWTNNETNTFFPNLLSSDNLIDYKLRIHSFHYDNDVFKSSVFTSDNTDAIPLKDRAKNLLSHIRTSVINKKQYNDIPIIFIVHSMGGLVTKSAIIQARDSQHTEKKTYYNIYKRFNGIVFYATPHIGAQLASIATAMTSAEGNTIYSYFMYYFGLQVGTAVKDMKLCAPALRELNQKFIHLIHNKKMHILCLYETKSVPHLNMKIVDAGECTGAYATNEPLGYDHLSICKPKSHSELRYKKARMYIEETMESLESKSDSGVNDENNDNDNENNSDLNEKKATKNEEKIHVTNIGSHQHADGDITQTFSNIDLSSNKRGGKEKDDL